MYVAPAGSRIAQRKYISVITCMGGRMRHMSNVES